MSTLLKVSLSHSCIARLRKFHNQLYYNRSNITINTNYDLNNSGRGRFSSSTYTVLQSAVSSSYNATTFVEFNTYFLLTPVTGYFKSTASFMIAALVALVLLM